MDISNANKVNKMAREATDKQSASGTNVERAVRSVKIPEYVTNCDQEPPHCSRALTYRPLVTAARSVQLPSTSTTGSTIATSTTETNEILPGGAFEETDATNAASPLILTSVKKKPETVKSKLIPKRTDTQNNNIAWARSRSGGVKPRVSDRGPAPGREVTPGVTVSVSRPGVSVSGPQGVTGSNIDMADCVSQTRHAADISDSELNSTDQGISENNRLLSW